MTFEMTSPAGPLTPTYFGHIVNTLDALILFECCLAGTLHHVARRPHDRERTNLIKSGNVFIYEEHSSGIKRWTDGVPWSPSRILGNFLVYRELERPFPPGEKKRAMKRNRRSPPRITKQESSSGSSLSSGYNANMLALSSLEGPAGNTITKDTERQLIGSLIDSYGFKEGGLVKKTVSVTIGSISHHLVSYYTVAEASSNRFDSPSKDPRFRDIVPRAELLNKQNFRVSIEEIESMDRFDDRPAPYAVGYPQQQQQHHQRAPYLQTNQSIHRPVSLPTPHNPQMQQYGGQNHNEYSNYGLPSNPAYQPGTQFNSQFAQPHFTTQQPQHGMYSNMKDEVYNNNQYRPQQRTPSISGLGSDLGRATMAPIAQPFQRRPSSYDQHNSADAGLAAMRSGSVDGKLTTTLSLDSGYASSPSYYPSRSVEQSPQAQQQNRFLPPVAAQQALYDQSPAQNPYTLASNSESRDHTWQVGNTSSGHAHFVNPQVPQQHWGNNANGA